MWVNHDVCLNWIDASYYINAGIQFTVCLVLSDDVAALVIIEYCVRDPVMDKQSS